ncbi:MAG: DNA primase [Bacilli bacterium]
MNFDRKLLDDLLKKADIANIVSRYIPITKKGRNFVALCPFHDDKNPSLSISPDKQIFKCFVCGMGGSAITFVQNYEKISFPQAVKKVADWVGFDDPRLKSNDQTIQRDEKLEPYFKCLEDLLGYYHFGLASEEGKVARDYLTQRGLDAAAIDTFQIGYALKDGASTIQFLIKRGHLRSIIEALGITASNQQQVDRMAGRVIFPIHNRDGRVVGFSGRILQDADGQAKYVNSTDSPIFTKGNILYHYHQVKLASKRAGHVYLMEGFMDVIALHRANIPQAIALMGTAVTPQHVKMLQALGVEIRICLDQDQAGQTAMMKMITPLSQANIAFRFVISDKETRDADEILLAEGEAGLKAYLDKLVAKMDYSFHYFQQVMPLTTTEQRVAFIKRMLPLIAAAPALEQIDYLKRLGQLTQYAVKDLQASLIQLQKQEPDYFATYRPEAKVLTRLKRAEKALLYNMFHSQDAIALYQQDIKFFHDDMYRQIATYLLEIYQSDPPNHQTLINHISLQGGKDQQRILNTIADLMSEKNLPVADKRQLLDYLNTLKEERDKLVKAHQLQASIAGKPELEQARIIKALHKQHHLSGGDQQDENEESKTSEGSEENQTRDPNQEE